MTDNRVTLEQLKQVFREEEEENNTQQVAAELEALKLERLRLENALKRARLNNLSSEDLNAVKTPQNASKRKEVLSEKILTFGIFVAIIVLVVYIIIFITS